MINSPEKEPRLVEIRPGLLTLGRASTNDIVIDDVSASRQHAEVKLDGATNTLTFTDLGSTNGTYINRQRIKGTCQLHPDDLVRIGQVVIHVSHPTGQIKPQSDVLGTHRFTRELVLESVEEHSLLIDEISQKLNTVFDVSVAINEVTRLMKRAMGVDYCEIILSRQLKFLETSDLTDPLAKRALRNRSAEVSPVTMYVPILLGEERVFGLIAMHKSRPDARPFGRRDVQLAVAVSHQAALTIQRMELLEKIRQEEQVRKLLLRFVSPTEAEFLLKNYIKSGELPGLAEQKVTVMFADIADSTGMAEVLGTKYFANVLNNFYQKAAEIVFQHKGMIKYLGDGILGIFPEQDGIITEEKAVQAGQALIKTLNRTGSLDPNRRLVFGVSINTGKAMVGYVGTRERAEFNALGDVVNIAYRMQEYARPYKIIVGPATVAAIASRYKFQRVGAVSIRGREGAIQAYEVLPQD